MLSDVACRQCGGTGQLVTGPQYSNTWGTHQHTQPCPGPHVALEIPDYTPAYYKKGATPKISRLVGETARRPMSRPRTYDKPRLTTGIRFPRDTHERLKAAAEERDLSINWLVNRAVEHFLARLIPVDELRLTREVTDE